MLELRNMEDRVDDLCLLVGGGDGTRTIGKMKVVGLKKKSLKSLCWTELFGCLNVYQILMVGPN